MKLIDLIGEKYGRLTVIARAENNGRRTMWLCKCDYGKEVVVRGENLRSGNTKSCGCISIEHPNHTKHGMSRSRLAGVYNAMKSRCYNKNNWEYDKYGGSGITICDEWLNDRTKFFDWAYKNGYDDCAKPYDCTIDRIDVRKGYCPENCRFVNMYVQANNTTRNVYYEYNGKSHTLPEWSRITGIKSSVLYSRINKLGWSINNALGFES